jgi:hypothetical protein
MVITGLLPLGISALIIYASYASGKMRYTLEEDDIRVNFPLAPQRITYDRIKSVGKVDTNLRLRLFGGSLPGSHWGRFMTSNLGSATIYATKAKGGYILIETMDGEKILISPSDPDAFLEALKGKTKIAAPALAAVEPPKLDRRYAAVQMGVVVVAWLLLVAYVASVYPTLPETIPVHFGLDGTPNRWGNKTEMLWLIGLAALFPGLNAFFTIQFGKYNRGLTAFLGVVMLLAVVVFGLAVNQILSAI